MRRAVRPKCPRMGGLQGSKDQRTEELMRRAGLRPLHLLSSQAQRTITRLSCQQRYATLRLEPMVRLDFQRKMALPLNSSG